ncbi:hypothetical protein ACFV0T_11710 [Streptomyces sp. NPDC059582]|uniref:hypothetical protein n=1 Tax=Streptomyces sp. NPDC059582 TaxID=3346875 RepID=UPI0036BA42AA
MNTDVRRPLPATAIPDGCLPWNTEQTRRWTRTLPPGWTPLRWPGLPVVQLALSTGGLAAFGLTGAGLPPYLAASAALHLVWLPLRPEIVRVSAPALAVVAVVARPAPGSAVLAGVLLLAGACAAVAESRLRARQRQREAALAAAEGVTAPLPAVDGPLWRGRILSGLGIALILAGTALIATAGLWNSSEDHGAAAVTGFFVAGLGVTGLLSGVLGRRRAAALRAAPVPVLRVLMRENESADAEVFAADDVMGLRPLFTVATVPLDPDTDEVDDEDEDKADREAELDDMLARLDDDRPRPLRQAVLYGTPYEGAELVLVSAAPEPGGVPVAERSTGPVRPLSEGGVRRRLRWEKRAAARTAADDEQHLGLVAAARLTKTVPVRRWRAGAVDWLAGLLTVQWGVWVWWAGFTDEGAALWQQILIVLLGLFGAARVAVKLCWRITADRTGLWLNGLRRTTHIPWDDVRSVRRESFELKLRWRGGESWTVSAPHWAWFQRRLGVTHPYDALAAEVTAMRTDPALRPSGDSEERGRGRPLWPLAVLFALLWLTAVLLGQEWFPIG